MRPIYLFILIISFLPLTSSAHPGKTDRHGGHQCLKDCAEWDLYYREYHTHDKDGSPVRFARYKTPRPIAAAAPAHASIVTPAVSTEPQPLDAASVLPLEPETPLLPWALLPMCLLLFLAVRRRRRDACDRSSTEDVPDEKIP